MERFVCAGRESPLLSAGALAGLGIMSPEALHLQPDNIVRAAERMEAGGWLRLPFCHTLCAEALGAVPTLTLTGAWITAPPYQLPGQLPAEIRDDPPRLTAMLEAAAELVRRGNQIAYSVEGPLTLLCALLSEVRVFTALCKPEGRALLGLAENWVSQYTAAAKKRGIQLISLADPVATADILGRRIFSDIYAPALLRLLRRLRTEHPGTPIHLCGKMSQCLLDAGVCSPVSCQPLGARSYGEALGAFCRVGEGAVLGQGCLRHLGETGKELWKLQWRDNDERTGSSAP